MENTCAICRKPYNGASCPNCTATGLDVSSVIASEGLHMQNNEGPEGATAFLVDLVSNRKIPITTPRCKVGRDDLNDIVISGDQSISRFHFVISKENGQYWVQDGKSRHGTFLNGNQISGPDAIHDGDVLKVGVSLFWFVIEAAAAQSAAPEQTAPVAQAEPAAPSESTKRPEPVGAESQKDTAHNLDLIKRDEAPSAAANSSATKEVDVPKDVDKASDKGTNDVIDSNVDPESDMTMDMLLNPLTAASEKLTEGETAQAQEAPPASPEPDNFDEVAAMREQSDTIAPAPRQPEVVEPAAADVESAASSPAPEPIVNNFDEDKLGKVEYQFDLSEKDITRAAERLQESYATDRATGSEPEEKSEPAESTKEKETLEKLAEVVGNATASEERGVEAPPSVPLSQYLNQSNAEKIGTEEPVVESEKHPIASSGRKVEQTSNGAKSVMSSTLKEAASSTVPDWCKKYFAGELTHLNRDLGELNEQVRALQNKIKDVEGRVALTKGLRNTLLTTQGDELVEACGKVLTMIGWRVRMSEEDKNEMRLESDDKSVCIARVVWTDKDPDRSHLGQLSISQTRYWCEQGVEPKGILLVSRMGEAGGAPLAPSDYNGELAEYASKKNVCLMTTLQLLSVYRDVVLNEGSPESVRQTISNSSGWLHGYHLEPGEEREESTGTNKLSSLLSA